MAAGCQVVVVQGKAFAEPWMKQSLPAILEAWQSGQAQGQAIAETLFGVNNPAGRTAVTFPSSADVLPVFYNYHPTATRGEWCAQTRTSSTLMGPLHQHRGLRGEGGREGSRFTQCWNALHLTLGLCLCCMAGRCRRIQQPTYNRRWLVSPSQERERVHTLAFWSRALLRRHLPLLKS